MEHVFYHGRNGDGVLEEDAERLACLVRVSFSVSSVQTEIGSLKKSPSHVVVRGCCTPQLFLDAFRHVCAGSDSKTRHPVGVFGVFPPSGRGNALLS